MQGAVAANAIKSRTFELNFTSLHVKKQSQYMQIIRTTPRQKKGKEDHEQCNCRNDEQCKKCLKRITSINLYAKKKMWKT